MERAAAVGIDAIPNISKQFILQGHEPHHQATLKLIVIKLKMLLLLMKNVGALILHLSVGRLEVGRLSQGPAY